MISPKIYIANKMRQVPWYNFPWFFNTARLLTIHGWDVINPAQMDLENGYNPYDLHYNWNWNDTYPGMVWEQVIQADEKIIKSEANAIYLGNLWVESPGARREKKAAEDKGILILYEKDGMPSPEEVL